jgi:hypothetical protein
MSHHDGPSVSEPPGGRRGPLFRLFVPVGPDSVVIMFKDTKIIKISLELASQLPHDHSERLRVRVGHGRVQVGESLGPAEMAQVRC